MQPSWITYVEPTGTTLLKGPRSWLNTTDYRLCLSIQELQDYVHPYLLKLVPPGLDWETTSLNVWKAHLVGLCLSFEPGKGLYVPVAHFEGPEYNLPLPGVVDVLKALDAADMEQGWYNYRYDSAVMKRDTGWEPTFGRWRDVMFGVHLENPNIKQYGLKFSAQRLLGIDMMEYTDLVPEGQGFHMVHPEKAPPYACADADMTRRLWRLPEVQAAIADQANIWNIEHRCLIPIREAVDHGLWLDRVTLEEQSREIGGVIRQKKGPPIVLPGLVAEARKKIFDLFGYEFNIDSGPQLGEALTKAGVAIEEKTEKKGQIATGKEILEKYAEKFPIIKEIVKYRELDKQNRDYIGKLLTWIRTYGPHARFAFNQIGAPTGRMSAGGEGAKGESATKGYVDLNVQSMPDHEKKPYLPNIRSAFWANDPRVAEVAEQLERECTPGQVPYLESGWGDEWVIVAMDYSQIELIVATNVFREPLWIDSFLKGKDIHATNAQLAYRDPTITKQDPRRKMGKTMNFATLYGAQAETVAEHGGITPKLAQEMMDNFFGAARQLKEGIENLQAQARGTKYVKTWAGRKRPLDEYYADTAPKWLKLKGDREAVNSPIQGGAADIFKIACGKVRSALIKHGWHGKYWFPILFVHDELVSIVRRAKLYEMVPVVKAAMEFPVKGWPVPIKVDAEVGWNWGELISWADWQDRYPPSTAGERLVMWISRPVSTDLPEALYNEEASAEAMSDPGPSEQPEPISAQ